MADNQEWVDLRNELRHETDPNTRNALITETIDRTVGSNNPDLQEMWLTGNNRVPDAARELAKQQSIQGIGNFKIPPQNSFAAHRQLVNAPKSGLVFDAKSETFAQFDGIIALCFTNKALTNKNHVHYEKYEAARENLAILRNVIYSQYFPEGSASNATEAQKQMVTTIANEIGNALQRGSLSLDRLNLPGEGAASMYDKLVDIQSQSRLRHLLSLRTLMHPSDIWNYPSRKFGLLPREQSALSDGGLSAPPPPPMGDAPPQPDRNSVGLQLNRIAADLTARAQRFESVKYLDDPVKEEAVEHARIILRNFAKFGEKGGIDAMMLQNPAEQLEHAEGILELTKAFESAMRNATDNNDAEAQARFQNNPEIVTARDAMGKLAMFLKVEALAALQAEGRGGEAAIVAEDIKNLPDEWRKEPGVSLESLLAKIEAGLEVAENEKSLSETILLDKGQTGPTNTQQPKQQVKKAETELRLDDQQAKKNLEAQLKKEMKNNPALAGMLKTGVKTTGQATVKSTPTPDVAVAGLTPPTKQR